MESMMLDLKQCIRDIPDFPKEGIVFKDISTLLNNKDAFKKVIDILTEQYKDAGIQQVVGVEARGFIFGSPLAYNLGAGFVPVRKKGKLPYKTQTVSYDLEYGQDTLEIHDDAIQPGDRVLIVDDVLATGGTIKAVTDLISRVGGNILSVAFIVELSFLNGKEKISGFPQFSIIQYD